MQKQNTIALFNEQAIRRAWHNEEWWFSVVDVVAELTHSPDAGAYWRKLKQRLKEDDSQVVTNCHDLKLEAVDGKKYNTSCANTQSLLRIIQSIPSPKAEPFKAWLAQVGFERIQEIENPELAQERMKTLYEQKGYHKDWIDKRLRGIAVRQGPTDEWSFAQSSCPRLTRVSTSLLYHCSTKTWIRGSNPRMTIMHGNSILSPCGVY